LFAQSVPDLAGSASANKAPKALNDYGFRNSSGSLAIFTAIRRALNCQNRRGRDTDG
jgi:hypothetical protein